MKISKEVPLLILGSASLLAFCTTDDDRALTQNTYASLQDCRQDWGNDERNCQYSGGGNYVGPRYYWDHETRRPYAVDPDGSTRALPNSYSTASSKATRVSHSSITRRGFGSTARGFSGGG